MYKKLKIIIPILLLVLFGLVQFWGLLPSVDNIIYDNLLMSERKPVDNIIIVGMDERSINEIGTWPWPRFYMADTISKLVDMDVAAIGASVLYDTYSDDEESDKKLVAAAQKSDRVVLAAMAFFGDESRRELVAEDYLLSFEELAEASRAGFTNVMPDESDGVMRHALTSFRYGDITVHSLALEVYNTYCRTMGIPELEEIPLDRMGQFPINYVAKPGKFTELSLWGVINDEYNPEMFRDAIVLIGPYAQGIGYENFITPLEKGTPTYGIEIYANIIQNLMEGSFKQEAPWWLDLAIMACLGLISMILLYRLKPAPAAILTASLVTLQLVSAKLAYTQLNLILHSGICIIFLVVCYLVNLILSILAAQNEKQEIQGLFGRFVAPEVVKEIIAGNVSVQLGGDLKEVSILFVDIRGFTAFSEANPPEKVVSMVNRYLSLTSHSIQDNGGTIDKYIGDATMAVFGAPNYLPDHAIRAVRTAWAMKQGSVALQKEILRDYGVDLQFGIGVNTGQAVVGNMGSDFRMDYTVIGDTVNTAARLEANAQKGQILISDATYQMVKDQVEVTDLGILNVKNKKVGIQIYNLDGIR